MKIVNNQISAILKLTALLIAVSFNYMTFAGDIPVVDGYSTTISGNSASTIADTSAVLSLQDLAQQLAQLKQQISAQNQVNLLGQVDNLQQQVQELTGRLEVEEHELKSLQEQQHNFYQDIDQRLMQLESIAKKPMAEETLSTNNSTVKPLSTNISPVNPSINASTIDINSSTPSAVAEPQAYQAAYNLVLQKQYQQAIAALQKLLEQYPKGEHAPNANYWLGELYLLQGDLAQAARAFNTVVAQFPQSIKVSDAMLKLGFIYYQQGQLQEAQDELKAVQTQFPDTTAARLASQRLQALQQANDST